jgi:hypothetical protein
LMLDSWSRMSASGSSLILCLVLVRAYFENATSQRYVKAKGSSFFTACFATSGYSLLSWAQNSNRFAGLKVAFRFLSAAMSISCYIFLTGSSKSSVEAENGFRSQLISSFGGGKYSLI